MIGRTLPWLVSLPLLVVFFLFPGTPSVFARPIQEPASQASLASLSHWQASTETPELLPTQAPASRPRRATPTPLPSLQRQTNPSLVIGAVIIVAIILFGVLRFYRQN